jgi:hypothetical protein
MHKRYNKRNAAHSLPAGVFDAAMLLMIATSDTLTAQPLQYVSPDRATDRELSANE